MRGYKTVKNPSRNDIVDATIKVSYSASLISSAQAAIDRVGDAAFYHDVYSTVDEVAAQQYAAERGLPLDTFSSRLQPDGTISEYPEDAKKARKKRTEAEAEAIDAIAFGMWIRRRDDINHNYPYFQLLDLSVEYVKAHGILEDAIGQEMHRADKAALEREEYDGEPSANIISWLSASFLTMNGETYKALLKYWRELLDVIPKLPEKKSTGNYVYFEYPEVKRALYRHLDGFFNMCIANTQGQTDYEWGVMHHYENIFYGYLEQCAPSALFVPTITETQYARYRGK